MFHRVPNSVRAFAQSNSGLPDRSDAMKRCERRILHTLQKAFAVFDEEQESFEDVLLESRRLDEALTPLSWILFFDAIYTLVIFAVSVRQTQEMIEQQAL